MLRHSPNPEPRAMPPSLRHGRTDDLGDLRKLPAIDAHRKQPGRNLTNLKPMGNPVGEAILEVGWSGYGYGRCHHSSMASSWPQMTPSKVILQNYKEDQGSTNVQHSVWTPRRSQILKACAWEHLRTTYLFASWIPQPTMAGRLAMTSMPKARISRGRSRWRWGMPISSPQVAVML